MIPPKSFPFFYCTSFILQPSHTISYHNIPIIESSKSNTFYIHPWQRVNHTIPPPHHDVEPVSQQGGLFPRERERESKRPCHNMEPSWVAPHGGSLLSIEHDWPTISKNIWQKKVEKGKINKRLRPLWLGWEARWALCAWTDDVLRKRTLVLGSRKMSRCWVSKLA